MITFDPMQFREARIDIQKPDSISVSLYEYILIASRSFFYLMFLKFWAGGILPNKSFPRWQRIYSTSDINFDVKIEFKVVRFIDFLKLKT